MHLMHCAQRCRTPTDHAGGAFATRRSGVRVPLAPPRRMAPLQCRRQMVRASGQANAARSDPGRQSEDGAIIRLDTDRLWLRCGRCQSAAIEFPVEREGGVDQC
jgi:hypothetical protein